jgi:hypothetical protein
MPPIEETFATIALTPPSTSRERLTEGNPREFGRGPGSRPLPEHMVKLFAELLSANGIEVVHERR